MIPFDNPPTIQYNNNKLSPTFWWSLSIVCLFFWFLWLRLIVGCIWFSDIYKFTIAPCNIRSFWTAAWAKKKGQVSGTNKPLEADLVIPLRPTSKDTRPNKQGSYEWEVHNCIYNKTNKYLFHNLIYTKYLKNKIYFVFVLTTTSYLSVSAE